MSIKTTVFGAITALCLALPALPAMADGMEVHDPYARVSSGMAASGAAFMILHNHGTTDDRLIGAASDVAEKVELHTHREDDAGVMRMIHVEEGFDLPADGEIIMQRGGHHVMFLGLKQPLNHGDVIQVTLQFEHAPDLTFDVPVDLERRPDQDAAHGHSHGHSHSHSHGQTKD